MSRKMIFFDIDGTLIDDKTKEIPASAAEAIRLTREKGNLTFINTGRTAEIVEPRIRALGFDGIVSGCGTYIYLKDEVLSAHTIPHEVCVEVVKKLREFQAAAFFEENSCLLFDGASPVKEKELENGKSVFYKMKCNVRDFWEREGQTFDKFFCMLNPNSDREGLIAYLSQQFTCIPREGTKLEVVPRGYSKATGIRFLQEHLGIGAEDCYVLGDSENDIEMFDAVPNAIAMGECAPQILERCSYQTAKVMEDGVFLALEHYGLI